MAKSRAFRASGWECLEGRSLMSSAGVTGGPPPTLPVPRTDSYSVRRLASNLHEARLGKAQIVVLGDSLADFWTTHGAASWNAVMAPRGAVDFGIFGNTTGQLLSQVAAGELKGRPKVVVLMIGANNIVRGNNPEQVVQGIAANVAAIRSASPSSKILLMGVLPILGSSGPETMKVTMVNAMLARLDDGGRVRFLNIYNDYLLPNGEQNRLMFVDRAHLSPLGYSTWARRISGTLDVLTGRAAPPRNGPLTPPPAAPPTAQSRPGRLA